jgi:hypothetical protein
MKRGSPADHLDKRGEPHGDDVFDDLRHLLQVVPILSRPEGL